MRGAAFLSGVAEAIVVDIGGTTSDVGALHKGFPRQATVAVEVGGVRTNFRMPDVFSIGLGGGSLVVDDRRGIEVGPTSVGYRLTSEALVFGGSTLTTTDVIVAAGRADLGDPRRSRISPKDLIARTQASDRRHARGLRRALAPLARAVAGHRRRRRLDPRRGPDRRARSGQAESLRRRQRGRRGDRAGLGRGRSRLFAGRDRPRAERSTTRSGARPTPRSPPARARQRSRSSTSRTCRSPICPATRRACASRSSENLHVG